MKPTLSPKNIAISSNLTPDNNQLNISAGPQSAMSVQNAEQQFRSITTIIKDLRMADLGLEDRTVWDKAKSDKDRLKSAYKKDTHILDSLCNILVRNPGDVLAALIAIHQSGAKLVVAESSPCVLATNSKEP